jgi:hypothetical protein
MRGNGGGTKEDVRIGDGGCRSDGWMEVNLD